MAKDLERYYEELERRVSNLEYDLNQYSKCAQPPLTLRDVLTGENFAEAWSEGRGSLFYGIRVGSMDREELLATIGKLMAACRRHGVFTI